MVADAGADLDPAETERLAAAYAALHETTGRRKLAAETRAEVVLFGDGGTPPDDRDNAWVASVGTLVGDPFADLAALEGNFCLFRAHGGSAEAAVDPFGMQPLYRARRGGFTYLSTSALALARHLRAQPDHLGLLVFLRTGYQVGARTHWEGIVRLDPATRLRFDDDGDTEDVYWRPERDPSFAKLSLSDTSSRCLEIGVETCRSLVAELPQMWADLTGGYDTRLLALLLRAADRTFVTNTVGAPETEDVRLAREVARRGRWPWVHFTLPAEWPTLLSSYVNEAVAAADAHLNALELAEVLWVHREKARDRTRLMNGGGGEHYQFHPWRTEFLRAGRSSEINWSNYVPMGLMRPLDTSVVRSFPAAEVENDLRERMARHVAPYADEPNTVKLDLLFAYRMTGHFGAYGAAARRYICPEFPFYTRPVFLAGFSSHHRHRNAHRLMRHMIERLDPSIAAVPTEKGGPAQPTRVTNIHRFVPYYTRLGRKAVNKVTDKVFGRPLLSAAVHVDPLRGAARAKMIDDLGLRTSDWRSGSLYEPPKLRELLDTAGQADFAQAGLLGRMITIELALRAAEAAVD